MAAESDSPAPVFGDASGPSAGLEQVFKPQFAQLWRPDASNGPQCEAYRSAADRLLYGGAAGGGTTDLLIGLALMEHARSAA